jgi:hypothetical protein
LGRIGWIGNCSLGLKPSGKEDVLSGQDGERLQADNSFLGLCSTPL